MEERLHFYFGAPISFRSGCWHSGILEKKSDQFSLKEKDDSGCPDFHFYDFPSDIWISQFYPLSFVRRTMK